MGLLNAALGEINLSAVSLVRNAIRKNIANLGILASEYLSDNVIVGD